MNSFLIVALGGAIGASTRYFAVEFISNFMGKNFPYGTLSVNVVGSFLIGIIANVLLVYPFKDPCWKECLKLLIMVGILGGFTTFSSFSLDTFNLLREEMYVKALFNILLNVCVCIFAVFSGWFLTNIVYK